MATLLPEEIVNVRPLVFLCGPLYDATDRRDRREVLRKYLVSYKQTIEYSHREFVIEPFALIIDNLFNNVDLEKRHNIALIEEVVAACAFKSYIFVDTLSTALELGLFSNSYSQNKTTALLPRDYMLYKPSVGYFVLQTIEKSSNITACFYKNKRINKVIVEGKRRYVLENLVGFRNKELPKEIKQEVKKDFEKSIERFIVRIEFTTQPEDTEKIFYQIDSNVVKMLVPPNILFYLTEECRTYAAMQQELLRCFGRYISAQQQELAVIYFLLRMGRMSLKVDSRFQYPITDVIDSMQCFIEALKSRVTAPQKYTRLGYRYIRPRKDNSFFSAKTLFGLSDRTAGKTLALYSNKWKAIESRTLIINGKKRKIDMYAGSSEGYGLRSVHRQLMERLARLIPLTSYSYAYKSKTSTLQCVQQHTGSCYFLKLDIKDFFHSISKQVMNKIIKCHLCDCPQDAYQRNVIEKDGWYVSSCIDDWTGVKELLDICFVNCRLSLGMVVSPILSNIYMDFFDARFHQQYPDLIYTRYSDDMLISSSKPFDRYAVMQYIEEELSYLKLEINMEKVHEYQLKCVGDHVKFLGLNLVQAATGERYITVGKEYIKDVCFHISEYERGEGCMKQSQILGQIEYIKAVSANDYQRLRRLYRVKNHREFDEEVLRRCED